MMISLVLATALAVALENLVENGDFERPFVRNFWGGPFGGGPGCLERSQENPHAGSWCCLIRKDKGPGGSQLMGSFPLGDVITFEYSFWYRGRGSAAYGLKHEENGTLVPTKNGAGNAFTVRYELPAAKEWTRWSKVIALPVECRFAGTVLVPQFQVWGGNSRNELWLDDIVIRPVDRAKPEDRPKVNVSVRMPEKSVAYGPVAACEAVGVTYEKGLILRDGKPYFWVGNGCDLGSAQSTPIGLWLARVQGVSLLGIEGGSELSIRENDPTNAVVSAYVNPANLSWIREANRLGFLSETILTAGNFRWSPLRKYSETHPDFAESYYNRGHGLSADTRTRLGRDIALASRMSNMQYTKDLPNFILELEREPGVHPSNGRCLRDFRKWCARKYGTLENACSVWRRKYASWDEVTPCHLNKEELAAGVSELSLRKAARANYPEFYWDWLTFLQLDTATSTSNEIADLRKAGVRGPLALDVRGHRIYNDTYVPYEPEVIDSMLDVFNIHFGCYSYEYNGTPWHQRTMTDQTAFPLMMYNYFRTNVRHPIVNCEDIVGSVALPGSNNEAMERNDLGQLHQTPWRFKIDEGDRGLAEKWFAADFNDGAWGEVRVPGSWDDQDAFKGRSGIGWYRKSFVARANSLDWRDGSHRFYIYGRGVAQRGTLWLNGKEVGKVNGWNSKYRFDVSEILNYGGTNIIVWRVDGNGFQNGLRFYCHLLAQDMINETKPFGESQYRSMLWTYMMRGTSGALVWHWFKDAARLYLPGLIQPLETAAEVVLSDLRTRKSDVAYLYAYLGGRGLPCPTDETHENEVSWCDALEFLGKRPDLVSERTFCASVTPGSHKVVVAPYQRFVRSDTWRHFKDYVEAGGTGIVTTGSFERTFARWERTDFAAWAQKRAADGRLGRGRLVVAPDGLDIKGAMAFLKPYLPAPELEIREIGPGVGEMPVIERCLAGGEGRKVVYLHNWGGQDHDCEVVLPEPYRTWRMTSLVGTWRKVPNGLAVSVRSQQPVAALLEAPGHEKSVKVRPCARHQAILDRLAALYADKDTGKPKVLWPDFPKPYYTPNGRELYPYLLDRIEAFGCEHVARPFEQWTDEMLACCKLVILPEGNSHAWRSVCSDKAFADRLRRYVEKGGSVLFLAMTGRTVNCSATIYKIASRAFGVDATWSRVCDPAHADFGDSYQVRSDAIERDELTEGVGSVSFFAMCQLAISKKSEVRPIVRIPAGATSGAGQPVLAAAKVGKGKAFFSADAMVFQPFRIEHADNAALLVNVMGWLLDKPVTQEMRDGFKANLFLTEKDIPFLSVK